MQPGKQQQSGGGAYNPQQQQQQAYYNPQQQQAYYNPQQQQAYYNPQQQQPDGGHNAQQQPGMQMPQSQQGSNAIMVGQPMPPPPPPVTVIFTPGPMLMICPYCRSSMTTYTSCSPSGTAWIFCLIMFLSGFGTLLCFLPLLLCQVTTHRCTMCNAVLGVCGDNRGMGCECCA